MPKLRNNIRIDTFWFCHSRHVQSLKVRIKYIMNIMRLHYVCWRSIQDRQLVPHRQRLTNQQPHLNRTRKILFGPHADRRALVAWRDSLGHVAVEQTVTTRHAKDAPSITRALAECCTQAECVRWRLVEAFAVDLSGSSWRRLQASVTTPVTRALNAWVD